MKAINGKIHSFINKISSYTDLRAFENFSFEINSEDEICIHGCKDMSEYDTGRIIVETDRYLINVIGENLKINNFSCNFTNICGKISGIEFCKIR